MAQRYTTKDARACFKRIAAPSWNLDCNSAYGGCRIENASGSVDITSRLPPGQFCQAVWFHEKMVDAKARGLQGAGRARKATKRRAPKRKRK